MRIAVNTRFLLSNRLEGIGWFSHEVVRRLCERHPNDEFLFFFDRPYDERFIFADNVKPIVVPPPARHPILWYLWFEWAVARQLKRHKPDVFLSPDGYCSLSSKVPTVMVSHDIAHVHYPKQVPTLARHYYDYFVPRYLKRAEQIVTVSHFVKKDIEQAYSIDSNKISVACNGVRPIFQPVDLEKQESIRTGYADGQAYFFYVGAVHPRKNLPRLIVAYEHFRNWTQEPVKLLIGGRLAWQQEEVKAAHAKSPYRDDIRFLGFVPDEDLPLLLGSSIALVYVSLLEGFGVPLLEAMQADVPVITSNVSSLPEVAGQAGICVNPKDEIAIAKAMQDVYQLPHLREELIAAGRLQVQKFSWDHATDVVNQALETCVNG